MLFFGLVLREEILYPGDQVRHLVQLGCARGGPHAVAEEKAVQDEDEDTEDDEDNTPRPR